MPVRHCRSCGTRYTEVDTQTAYHFSSALHPIGSYVSAATIIAAATPILTCPHDAGTAEDGLPSLTQAGGDMRRGADRREGDETHPTRDEL